jgi:membrane protease YdiL (CAAX protease family)
MSNILENIEPPQDKDKGDLVFYIFLILAFFLGAMIGTLFVYLLGGVLGISIDQMMGGIGPDADLGTRNGLRITNGISHFFTFTVAALGFAYYFFGPSFRKKLGFRVPLRLSNVGYAILIMICSFPFIQLLYYLNRQLPLPDSLIQMEASAENMLQAILTMNSPSELLLNLFVVALLPALGEELIFRGLVQQRLYKYFSGPHLPIWITALVFSAIHFQFEGFLPRLLLGAVLGYLFYWSKNLWIPILAHFVFNGMQVVGQYFLGDEIEKLELAETTDPNWFLGLASLVLMLVLGYFYIQSNNRKIT